MLQSNAKSLPIAAVSQAQAWYPRLVECGAREELERSLQGLGLRRRLLQRGDYLFRAGQGNAAQFLIRSGSFKTAVGSEDGRAKITGFHYRGDLLGLDAIGAANHGCDAVALDVGEVLELPDARLSARLPKFQLQLTAALAREIRAHWGLMLMLSSLNADQRVISFLLDLAERQRRLGFSPRQLQLRMTRSDLGSFLALQLETVTRALSRLGSLGLIRVSGREIRIEDENSLRKMITRVAIRN